jgi:hypothetical protein
MLVMLSLNTVLMNTNTELNTEEASVEYILNIIRNLEEMSDYIKGIHLNSSLSGEYVKEIITSFTEFDKSEGFFSHYIKEQNEALL